MLSRPVSLVSSIWLSCCHLRLCCRYLGYYINKSHTCSLSLACSHAPPAQLQLLACYVAIKCLKGNTCYELAWPLNSSGRARARTGRMTFLSWSSKAWQVPGFPCPTASVHSSCPLGHSLKVGSIPMGPSTPEWPPRPRRFVHYCVLTFSAPTGQVTWVKSIHNRNDRLSPHPYPPQTFCPHVGGMGQLQTSFRVQGSKAWQDFS